MKINVFGEKIMIVETIDYFGESDYQVAVGQEECEKLIEWYVTYDLAYKVYTVDCEVYRLHYYDEEDDEWYDLWTTLPETFEQYVNDATTAGVEFEQIIYKKPTRTI